METVAPLWPTAVAVCRTLAIAPIWGVQRNRSPSCRGSTSVSRRVPESGPHPGIFIRGPNPTGTPVGKHWFQAHGPTRDFEGTRTASEKHWFQAHGPTQDFGGTRRDELGGTPQGLFPAHGPTRDFEGTGRAGRGAPPVGQGTALSQSRNRGSRPRGRSVQRSSTRGHPRPSQCTECSHQRQPAGARARGPAQKSPSGTHHSQDPECSETQETAPPAHRRPASQNRRTLTVVLGLSSNPNSAASASLGSRLPVRTASPGAPASCASRCRVPPASLKSRLDVGPGFPPECAVWSNPYKPNGAGSLY